MGAHARVACSSRLAQGKESAWDAQPNSSGGAAARGEVFAGGFDIRGKNRKKKNEKAKSSERARTGNHNADGAENFANAGEINQGHRMGEDGRHHTGKFVTNFVEVSSAGEEEHDREGVARGIRPGVEEGYAGSAESAKEEEEPIRMIRTGMLNILEVKKTEVPQVSGGRGLCGRLRRRERPVRSASG